MDIERKKVESIGGFTTKTKATLAALLGLSAALTVSATPADSTNTIPQDSTASLSSSSDSTVTQKVPEAAIERNVTQ